MNLEEYADILEHELKSAVEVKDKDSLHRAVRLIAENTVGRREYDNGIGQLKSDVRLIAERIESMQTQMNQRFEAVDKRFDDMNGKIRMLNIFLTLGFTIVTTEMMLINFLR